MNTVWVLVLVCRVDVCSTTGTSTVLSAQISSACGGATWEDVYRSLLSVWWHFQTPHFPAKELKTKVKTGSQLYLIARRLASSLELGKSKQCFSDFVSNLWPPASFQHTRGNLGKCQTTSTELNCQLFYNQEMLSVFHQLPLIKQGLVHRVRRVGHCWKQTSILCSSSSFHLTLSFSGRCRKPQLALQSFYRSQIDELWQWCPVNVKPVRISL